MSLDGTAPDRLGHGGSAKAREDCSLGAHASGLGDLVSTSARATGSPSRPTS